MNAEGTAMTSDPPEDQAEAEWQGRRRLSRTALLWYTITAVALVAWFFFAWLVLNRMVLDAAGEAIGSGLLLLVIVSVIGALARSSRW
jgi:hypothetical protein